ncbi:hypothetical protein ATE67_11140 [Sphingopyxis sp. H050]|nr:hypothetical protein ATE67_11140 [Sphingopyxis sp. H050]
MGKGTAAKRWWWRDADSRAIAPPSALRGATSPWLRRREDFPFIVIPAKAGITLSRIYAA